MGQILELGERDWQNDKEEMVSMVHLCVLATWHTWKHRNERIFRNKQVGAALLAERIIVEGEMWENYC